MSKTEKTGFLASRPNLSFQASLSDMGLSVRKSVLGVSTNPRLKPACSAIETS